MNGISGAFFILHPLSFILDIALVEEQRDELDGFSQAHVVGEAAADTEGVEEGEPLEAAKLVGAEGAEEVFGLDDVGGAHGGELFEKVLDPGGADKLDGG